MCVPKITLQQKNMRLVFSHIYTALRNVYENIEFVYIFICMQSKFPPLSLIFAHLFAICNFSAFQYCLSIAHLK